MLAGIWGFLSALPELIGLIKTLIDWINKISGNDPAGFLLKTSAAFNQLNAAKTEEEYRASAKAIADAIASIRK